MEPATATHNQPAYSVTEIAGAVKRAVEENLGYVRVRGEISGCKIATSGHAYLTLKDENAVLDAVCWRGTLGKLPLKMEDGIEVIAAGRITTYPGRSKYQMVIEWMEPAGVGALMAILEKRKAALAAEGLFDPARKKKLPYLPEVIGVITSPTGAVIRDILHRIGDRFPRRVLVWPVMVQGEGAAAQIAEAIEGFNQLPVGGAIPRPDLLIVARGGGSIEDLWAFNEEIVVRAAANSGIPLISAVGHETDTTLIDYASDMRAPTPTAAAELAVPVREALQMLVEENAFRIQQSLLRRLTVGRDRVEGLARGLPSPQQMLAYAMQRLDDWSERLKTALPSLTQVKTQQLAIAAARLSPASLMQTVKRQAMDVIGMAERLDRIMVRQLQDKQKTLAMMASLIAQLDYQQILKRGFALVRDGRGKLVTSVATVSAGDAYRVTLADGEFGVTAKK